MSWAHDTVAVNEADADALTLEGVLGAARETADEVDELDPTELTAEIL